MSRLSLRAEGYRAFQKHVLKPLVFSRVFKNPSERGRIFREIKAAVNPTIERPFPVGWFHAASVGELEMLTPVIEKWASLSTGNERTGLVITVFSESAEGSIQKLSASLRAGGARLLFAGYAPWEGEWQNILARANPEFMMTARYEAWPELWMSLADQGIPLVVVGAKARPSLSWAKRIAVLCGERVPKILFCVTRESELASLRAEFLDSEFVVAGDPRWERVTKRSAVGNPRARELIERFSKLPRPWGVLGSAWKEDLEQWSAILRGKKFRGTLWVVPHRVEEGFVAPIEEVLDSCGVSHARARQNPMPQTTQCLVVDEMGFLAELYSAADWAYVGGGFSEGVHNTIEPAIHGIPVACGSLKSERFPEIEILKAAGQLQLTRNAEELSLWLGKAQGPLDEAARLRWKEQAQSHLGASEAVMRALVPRLSGWRLGK